MKATKSATNGRATKGPIFEKVKARGKPSVADVKEEGSTKARRKPSSAQSSKATDKGAKRSSTEKKRMMSKEGSSSAEAKKKRRKTKAEIIDEAVKEESVFANAKEEGKSNLFDFLYQNSNTDDLENSLVEDYSVYFTMFNPDIDLDKITFQNFGYISTYYEEFNALVEDESVNMDGGIFIHLTSIGNKNSSSRRAIARRINLLPSHSTKIIEKCPFHKGGACRVVEKQVAFICYLSSLGNSEEEKSLQDQFFLDRAPTEKQEKEEEDDNYEEEKVLLTEEEKK